MSDNLIFGYTFEQIQRAQQGGQLGETVKLGQGNGKSLPTIRDIDLLKTYGEQRLRELGYHGTLDRLGLPLS